MTDENERRRQEVLAAAAAERTRLFGEHKANGLSDAEAIHRVSVEAHQITTRVARQFAAQD